MLGIVCASSSDGHVPWTRRGKSNRVICTILIWADKHYSRPPSWAWERLSGFPQTSPDACNSKRGLSSAPTFFGIWTFPARGVRCGVPSDLIRTILSRFSYSVIQQSYYGMVAIYVFAFIAGKTIAFISVKIFLYDDQWYRQWIQGIYEVSTSFLLSIKAVTYYPPSFGENSRIIVQ